MNYWIIFGFLIFPYISLTVMIAGHLYRYVTNPFRWNSRSSELLEKKGLFYGSFLFHYGIILALIGHIVGLLIPQAVYTSVGIGPETHDLIAVVLGIIFGWSAFLGLLVLIGRRIIDRRMRSHTSVDDFVTLFILLVVIGIGTYNVTFSPFPNVLFTVAPWLRSILSFVPKPRLLLDVPASYKAHIIGAFILFAYYPFSRLVHISSAPFTYIFRVFVLFRKRTAGS